ncbi:MAG: sensor domain-containing diguanylate cyclase [Pseudomonadota bacterium]
MNYFLPFFLAGGVAAVLHFGGRDYPLWGMKWLLCAALIVSLVAIFLFDLVTTLRRKTVGRNWMLKEFRLLFVTSSLVMLGADFAASSGIMFYPLVFLLVLYAGTFSNYYSLGGVAAFVTVLHWITGGGPRSYADITSSLTFSGFVVVFGAFGVIFLRAEVIRLRAMGEKAVKQFFEGLVEMARSFRLISMPSTRNQGVREDRKVKILSIQSALEETRTAIYTMLETLKSCCSLHSCVVLWRSASGGGLKVIEAATISENLVRGEIPAQLGVTGMALQHGKTVSLFNDELRNKVIPYYREFEDVRSICIVPIIEDKEVRGLLCADRLGEDEFTAEEKSVLGRVSGQIVRFVRTERTILHMARSRHEQGKLYSAASRLKDAVREDQVVEVLFDSARDIMRWDFAAFTTCNPSRRTHRLAFAEGKEAESIRGLEFSSNDGLVSQAVKLRHSLPWKGEYDPRTQIIFTKKIKFSRIRSLVVIPVITGEKVLGTVVLAAERQGALSSEKSRLLQVIVDQSAVAYQNAGNMQKLEEMASTDALTGLFNRRVFLEALVRKLGSAVRFNKPLSVIMTDLDRFKSVNDTHGHHVGDEVLRMFAAVLKENARQVDLVARWGGEEFIIVCEETDREGAHRVAERIRSDMEAQVLEIDAETNLQVTCSLGVSSYPHDAQEAQALIQKADEYLYMAKRQGRNRVISSTGLSYKEAG